MGILSLNLLYDLKKKDLSWRITGARGQERPPPPVHPHPKYSDPRDFIFILIKLSFHDIFLI